MLRDRRHLFLPDIPAEPGIESGSESALFQFASRGSANMMKVLLWIVGIIFLIGLLVVFGVIDLIF